jgi:hypothetical protein
MSIVGIGFGVYCCNLMAIGIGEKGVGYGIS